MDVDGAKKLQHRTVSELVPYARNARLHSEEQVAKIAASIGRYGFNNPVLVDAAGGIIAGHGRVMAAKRLGMDKVPVIELGHLSETEKREYILADNKLAELSEWDEAMLADEIRDLQLADADFDVIGFSDKEMDGLLREPDPAKTDADQGDDETPAPPEEPKTQPGDLWVLGAHRLVCGDSTEPESFVAVLGDGKAAMCFTDPPYGMSYDGGRAAGSTPKGARVKAHSMIKGDDLRGDSLEDLVTAALTGALAGLEDKAAVYVCFTWRTWAEFEAALDTAGLESSACIVWDKRHMGLGHSHYRPQHEFIFYCSRGEWYGDKAASDVWVVNRAPSSQYVHPTQKPVKLIEKALRNSSRRGDAVLDPFGGSGSTLIACEKMGRQARLIELDPKYCDVIVKRWQDFTGETAILEATGQTFDEVAADRAAAA